MCSYSSRDDIAAIDLLIFLTDRCWTSIPISLQFVPRCTISVGVDIGLVVNRRSANIWSKCGKVYRHIYIYISHQLQCVRTAYVVKRLILYTAMLLYVCLFQMNHTVYIFRSRSCIKKLLKCDQMCTDTLCTFVHCKKPGNHFFCKAYIFLFKNGSFATQRSSKAERVFYVTFI